MPSGYCVCFFCYLLLRRSSLPIGLLRGINTPSGWSCLAMLIIGRNRPKPQKFPKLPVWIVVPGLVTAVIVLAWGMGRRFIGFGSELKMLPPVRPLRFLK